jgi:serine protease 16|eukprot:SAG25_NODE_1860_length_2245_cov_3.735322_2_plen_273_part_00
MAASLALLLLSLGATPHAAAGITADAAATIIDTRGFWGLSFERRANFVGHHRPLLASTPPGAAVDTKQSTQPLWFDGAVLDHFAPAAERTTWSQRYYVNDTLWGGPGFPVLLYIGGEGAESGRAISGELFISHLAEKHQALLVDVEHRFYGESHPTPAMDDASMRYLSSQQALADLSHFVEWFSRSYGSDGTGDSPWVCFGGSYPGDLSAWFRLKYPHLVVGAVASSAPVLAKQDMPEYMDVVGRSLRRDGGQSCYEAVQNGTRAVARLLAM